LTWTRTFVIQRRFNGVPRHYVMVMESKGAHLEGNPDTDYNRKVASYFNQAGRRVTWQKLGEAFKDHQFCFQVLDEAQPEGREWKRRPRPTTGNGRLSATSFLVSFRDPRASA
jgi:hypothetical protein